MVGGTEILYRLGLQQAARDWAADAVAEIFKREVVGGAEPQTRQAALRLLRTVCRDPEALGLVERLALRYRGEAAAHAYAAYAYAAAGLALMAARLFEQAVLLGGDFAWHAAAQYLAAGRHEKALAMNARVADRKRRLVQRSAVLFASGAMARVAALEEPLAAAAAIGPRVRYLLAYANYALGHRLRARRHLRHLRTDPTYRGSAEALLAATQDRGVP